MISDRVKGISPSATLSLNAKVKEMQKAGKDIVLFGAGQPDFSTPENIKKAALRAMKENLTGYTAVGGIPELKKAIKEKFKRDNGLDYGLNEILVSNGGKHSIYNIFMALLNKGDEVMLPLPYWLSYEEQIKLAGGKPVFVETDEELKIKSELIEEALSENTKILLLNSPNNPSGKVIEEKELKERNEKLRRERIEWLKQFPGLKKEIIESISN
ncbi:aminotransferase class I/II-fold pyridoxal phosphate-dependent enzyme [Candidatus Micrarchaeota archaeon]|nr:aminotransferase class I/II-fold pyridoxal phosphate-dependent enzyme [Candidatus Micrarchaeota archaeon]